MGHHARGLAQALSQRTGKNLLDPSIGHNWSFYWAFGSSGTGSNVPDGSLTLQRGIYTFSCNQNATTLSVRTSETNEIARVNNASSVTFTLDENHVVKIGVVGFETFADFQLELGSTATAYEPYQVSTYTTSLGQTVYGGTLDMVSGVLTVTHGNIASYNGETLPSTWISDRDVYASGTTPTTGAQVVYELATPLTYTLTPQQVKTLVGTNNVWASSGQIVSIKFTYGGLLSELPSDATSIVGKCYCDVEQNGVSSMPFTLNVKKNERES